MFYLYSLISLQYRILQTYSQSERQPFAASRTALDIPGSARRSDARFSCFDATDCIASNWSRLMDGSPVMTSLNNSVIAGCILMN